MLADDLSAKSSRWLIGLALAALFLVRLVPWMTADLWFDEVLTIDDYIVQPKLAGVLLQYPVANNHVLYSALLWCWARLIDPFLFEFLLRLPSAIFSAAIVVLAAVHWEKWLGRRGAIACAVTFAASLIVASFAWQLRGYSLSMFLAALLLSGMLEVMDGNRRRGLILAMISAILLPIVLPTNLLVVFAGLAYFLMVRPAEVTWDRWLRSAIIPIGLAGMLGASYYLLVLDQFLNVLKHAEGWPSAPAVLGAVGLALAAHLGPIGAVFLFQHRLPTAKIDPACSNVVAQRSRLMLSWKMLLPIAAIGFTVMFTTRPAPFPRNFLIFLPAITFAVCLACRDSIVLSRLRPLTFALIICAWGIGWHFFANRATVRALKRGEHPQNLILEYYRGRDDISAMSAALKDSGAAEHLALLTDFHDFSTTRYYWRLERLPAENVLATFKNFAEWKEAGHPDLELAVQAVSESHAAAILRDAGQSYSRLDPVVRSGILTVYRVAP